MLIKILVALVISITLFIVIARRTSSKVNTERTFNAPVEKVWKVFTDAEMMKSWWSPKDYTAPVIKHDFRVGGNFLYSMRSPKGEMFWNTGTYKEIIPLKKITSALSFSDEKGTVLTGSQIKVPGVWPDSVSVTVHFEDLDGKTKVSVEEVGIPFIMKLFAKMGWDQQFDKFEKLL